MTPLELPPQGTEEALARPLRVDVTVQLSNLLGTPDPLACHVAALVGQQGEEALLSGTFLGAFLQPGEQPLEPALAGLLTLTQVQFPFVTDDAGCVGVIGINAGGRPPLEWVEHACQASPTSPSPNQGRREKSRG